MKQLGLPGLIEARLKIVAYGFVDREGGSVASASYLVLDQFLERGHHIEFHAIAGFIEPKGLIGRRGFVFIPTSIGALRAAWRVMEWVVPARLRRVPNFALSQVSNAIYERSIGRLVRRRHAEAPFDLFLVLGTLPPFVVPGLPCVAWPQGAPNGEWEALRGLRAMVVKHGGRELFLILRVLYARKQSLARRVCRQVDMLICGSRWSVENWVRLGAARESCRSLPYPVDLDQFRPEEASRMDRDVITFLWLGRVVPRKRLDLLLDAYSLLRAERQDVRLKIVGRFGYARGLRRLLDRFGPDDGVFYSESAPREAVPELLRSVDVLIQPSMNEDVGSSVLEALACGTLAIIGPSNGTRDYLSASSVVFDAYMPESLKLAMSRAIQTLQASREACRLEARACAERTFSAEVVAEGLEGILGESLRE